MLDFLTLQTSTQAPTLLTVAYTMLLCFILSTVIGLTYVRTFRGLSYSRNYVQAIILSSMVAAVVMLAIGDSLARGLGMIGALAIIRFRTNFKDPKDIIFMFAALGVGISCGVGAYVIAIGGAGAFSLIAFVLYLSPFTRQGFFDGMLRFDMAADNEHRLALEQVLKGNCKKFALITLRDISQGERIEYAYHVKLRRGKSKAGLIDELRTSVASIHGVSLMLQETTIEL